jgi:hypothetical protein
MMHPDEKLVPETTQTQDERAHITVGEELRLKERVNRAEGELRAIDNLIARRPALDEPTRYDNIAKAIRVASEADRWHRIADERSAELIEVRRQLELLKGNYDRKVDECRAEFQRVEIMTAELAKINAKITAMDELIASWIAQDFVTWPRVLEGKLEKL